MGLSSVSPNKNNSQCIVPDTVLNTNILLLNPHKRHDHYIYFTDEKTRTQKDQGMCQGHTASKRWRQDLHSERPRISVCVFNRYTRLALARSRPSILRLHTHLKNKVSICLSFLLPSLLAVLPFFYLFKLLNISGLSSTNAHRLKLLLKG